MFLTLFCSAEIHFKRLFVILLFSDITPIHSGPQSESPVSSPRLEVVETSDTEIIKNETSDIVEMISTTNTAELLRQNLIPSFAVSHLSNASNALIQVSFLLVLKYKLQFKYYFRHV